MCHPRIQNISPRSSRRTRSIILFFVFFGPFVVFINWKSRIITGDSPHLLIYFLARGFSCLVTKLFLECATALSEAVLVATQEHLFLQHHGRDVSGTHVPRQSQGTRNMRSLGTRNQPVSVLLNCCLCGRRLPSRRLHARQLRMVSGIFFRPD